MREAGDAGVDVDLLILEEAGVGRVRVGACRGGRDCPQVIARRVGRTQRGIGATVLRHLLAPPLARYLHIGTAEYGVPGTYRNCHVGFGRAFDPFAGDVVMEPRRRRLAGGVVEHLPVFNTRERLA